VIAFEAFILELGRRLVGVFSVPFVAGLVGAQISTAQGAKMAAIFFGAGFAWNCIGLVLCRKIIQGFKKWRSNKKS